MAPIILISDVAASLGVIAEILSGHSFFEAGAPEEVCALASERSAAMVIIEQVGDSRFALDALSHMKRSPVAHLPVIVIANVASGEEVIEAMRLGAFDHLNRPVVAEELRAVVARASGLSLSAPVLRSEKPEVLCGSSAAIRALEKLVGAAAATSATVLIQGETGTGKGTVARAIHRHSKHNAGGLAVVDCTAVPEDYGSFQALALGAAGSVILDEVGDLSNLSQALLVRALNELVGQSDVRIIATTQYDLISLVKEKRFREDLFYRLNVLRLVLPPLRERGADILALADTFLQQASTQPKTLSSSAAKTLLDCSWPGNVRQLENLMYHLSVTVRAAVIDDSDIDRRILGLHLSESQAASVELPEATEIGADSDLNYYRVIAATERNLLERALFAASGSRSEAARLLGINRQLLYAKLKTHGLGS